MYCCYRSFEEILLKNRTLIDNEDDFITSAQDDASNSRQKSLVPSSFPIRMRRDRVGVNQFLLVAWKHWELGPDVNAAKWNPRESTGKPFANKYALLMLYYIYCKQLYL